VTRAVVALGSNIGAREHLPRAIGVLRRHPALVVEATSHVYESAPVGNPGDPWFLNAAVLVATSLDPDALRGVLRDIEAGMGRVRTEDRNAPRTIDLDIVLVEDFEGEVGGSPVPDPEITVRPHLALPVADVVPDWVLAGAGASLAELAASFEPNEKEIRRMTADIAPATGDIHYATETGMEEMVPNEVFDPALETNVRTMLSLLGEDPDREGLLRTPLRVAKAMNFLTSGYTGSLEEVVNNALFASDTDEMVLVKDVEFYSLCEHHMLPFFGKAHVAYLPKDRIIGVSKIARIVDLFARRLQVQERLTCQVAAALEDVLDPHGVAVVMEGSHFCMMMRGVQKQGSSMVTSAMRGSFKREAATRAEFMELIRS
jgi:GTP cyclohydrolase I